MRYEWLTAVLLIGLGLGLRFQGLAAGFTLFGIHIHVWVVASLVGCLGSWLTVVGLALQRKGAHVPGEHFRIGDVAITRTWIAGFALVVAADVPFTMTVYSLAPIGLIALLSGMTVVLNFCAAPSLVGQERHTWPDLPATMLIVAGIALGTLVHAVDEPEYDAAMLWDRLYDPAFQIAMAAVGILVACCIGNVQRSTTKSAEAAKMGSWRIQEVVLPALAAAGCGLFSSIGFKVTGIILAPGKVAPAMPWLLAALVPACLQVNYLNLGMQLYPQAVFIPIYCACLMLATSVGGAFFYEDFSYMDWQSTLTLFGGAAAIASGIGLFALRGDSGAQQAQAASQI